MVKDEKVWKHKKFSFIAVSHILVQFYIKHFTEHTHLIIAIYTLKASACVEVTLLEKSKKQDDLTADIYCGMCSNWLIEINARLDHNTETSNDQMKVKYW